MARASGGYSRLIAWLKILLPIAALAMLSTIVLLASDREVLENVPFAEALRQGETATEGVSDPYYSGTTRDGGLLTMTARRAWPLEDGDILADRYSARMQMEDGSVIQLDSSKATMREGERKAYLDDGVRIESSLGYVLTTNAMVSALDSVNAESLGPVEGNGPAEELEAGRMVIAPADEDGAVQIHFTGGVKMIYRPADKEVDE